MKRLCVGSLPSVDLLQGSATTLYLSILPEPTSPARSVQLLSCHLSERCRAAGAFAKSSMTESFVGGAAVPRGHWLDHKTNARASSRGALRPACTGCE